MISHFDSYFTQCDVTETEHLGETEFHTESRPNKSRRDVYDLNLSRNPVLSSPSLTVGIGAGSYATKTTKTSA